MKNFTPVYVPVGVPTFHLESAQRQFELSVQLLRGIDEGFAVPEKMLLSIDDLRSYLDGLSPDLIVFQNLTFANAAYMSEVLRRFDCPVLLWTLREPVIDGGRLRLNSLTGAYSAANTLRAFDERSFEYLFGSPEEERVKKTIGAVVKAASLKKAMRGLKMSAVGHTPQGFGFGRALDSERMNAFGVELEAIEARELIEKAKQKLDELDASGKDLRRLVAVIGGGTGFVGVENIDQVMRHARPFGVGRLGGADIHPAVDLHRVAGDDLAPESLGERKRERALARRGRPDDGEDRSVHGISPSSHARRSR